MPPQTVVTGTQIPLDQAQIDYWLGQLQGNQRGQNFGLGSNILDFITNRDRNRAGANAAYGQLGTSIAALNASQRGQLASAQQAAIQMLADRTGPQNAVAYQRALAGLSGPGPNQGQATIDPLALLRDFYQPASIEDIYPGGPPQASGIDVEEVLRQIFGMVGQPSGGGGNVPPPDPTVPPEPPGPTMPEGDGTGDVPPLKAAVFAAQKAYDAAPEGPQKEALRQAMIEAINAWLFSDDGTAATDPAANGGASLVPSDPNALPTDESGVKQALPTIGTGYTPPPPGQPVTKAEAEAAAAAGDTDTINRYLFGDDGGLPDDDSGVAQLPPTIGGADPTDGSGVMQRPPTIGTPPPPQPPGTPPTDDSGVMQLMRTIGEAQSRGGDGMTGAVPAIHRKGDKYVERTMPFRPGPGPQAPFMPPPLGRAPFPQPPGIPHLQRPPGPGPLQQLPGLLEQLPTNPAVGAGGALAPPDPAVVPPAPVPPQPSPGGDIDPGFFRDLPQPPGIPQSPRPPQAPFLEQLPQPSRPGPGPLPGPQIQPFRPPPGAPPLAPVHPFLQNPPSGAPPLMPTPVNQGFPAAAYGGTYDQGPVIVGERGPELASASPSGLLQVQPISQGQAQALAAPQQMPMNQMSMQRNLIGSASRQPGRSRQAATGGTFEVTSYSDPQLVNAPPIQQLQGEVNTPSFQNLDTEFGGERLPSVINLQRFGQLDPSSQEYTQGIYNQGAQVDFRDIIARSLRAAPQGASFGPARYRG